MIENPIYLGDDLYATFDDFHIILTSGHHDPIEAKHVVYLDKDVMKKFLEWQESLPNE